MNKFPSSHNNKSGVCLGHCKRFKAFILWLDKDWKNIPNKFRIAIHWYLYPCSQKFEILRKNLALFSSSVVIWNMWMPSSFNLIATNNICSDVYNDSCKCYTFLLYISNACLGTWPRYNSGSFHDELHRNTLTLDTSCKRKKNLREKNCNESQP